MINAQILPTAFYGIQNFLDNLNAEAAKGECTYTPKADYYETENGFALEVELPGVKKEDMDIKVSLENGILKFDLSKKAQAAARKLTIG